MDGGTAGLAVTARPPAPTNRSYAHAFSRSPGLDALAYVSDALSAAVPGLSLDGEPDRVMAYAKVEFPEHDFYVRKTEIVIGRRPPNPPPVGPGGAGAGAGAGGEAAKHEESAESLLLLAKSPPLLPKTTAAGGATGADPAGAEPGGQPAVDGGQVDVDLGPIRAVSRDHARIFYCGETGSWKLKVNGRNGLVLEGRWLEKGEEAALGHRTRIQIAERIFYFVLPDSQAPGSATVDPKGVQADTDEEPAASASTSGTSSDAWSEEAPPTKPSPSASAKPSKAGKMPAKAPRAQFRKGGAGAGGGGEGKGGQAVKAERGREREREREKRPPAVAPEGAEVGTLVRKPPYTYASLIAQALTALNEGTPKGKGKEQPTGVTLAEVCEWIRGAYPYFGEGGAGTTRGTDWQASIRSNLNSDKRFLKADNPAAVGVSAKTAASLALWSLDPAERPAFTGLEFRKPRPDPPPAAPAKPTAAPLRTPAPPIIVTSNKGPPRTVPPPQPPPAPPATAKPAPPPFKIVIGEIPMAARPAVPAEAQAGDDLASIMQRDPPMVSHDGKLLLNPVVFAQLDPAHVAALEKLGPEQALKILQNFIVQHYKEQMKRAKQAARKKDKGAMSDSPASVVAPSLPRQDSVEGGGATTPAVAAAVAATTTKRKADEAPEGQPEAKVAAG